MFFKYKTQRKNLRADIDALLAKDKRYQELAARLEGIMVERKEADAMLVEMQKQATRYRSPAAEAQAIADGTLSPSMQGAAITLEEMEAAARRAAVLGNAAKTLSAEIAELRQASGREFYENEFRADQMESAEKTVDALLDMAAIRAEENRQLMDMQTAGTSILDIPRVGIRWCTAAFIEEYVNTVRGCGFKPSLAQQQRLEGIKTAEIA